MSRKVSEKEREREREHSATERVSGASERKERATEWPVCNAIVTSRNSPME